MFNKIYSKVFLDYIILFFFISFIFLFSLKFEFLQFRYLILFLLIPCYYYFWKDFKDRNFIFLKYSIYFLLFFLLHLLINLHIESKSINFYSIFSLIFLFIIFTISFYFFNFFNQNIEKLIFIFITLFFISSLTNIYNFQYDAPYFCGGLPDIFNIMDHEQANSTRSLDLVRVSFREYIFNENSHLGMVAPGIIAFLINLILKKKISLQKKIIFFIFICICFVKSSTTLLLGTILSLLILIIFNYQKLSKKLIFSFAFIILIFGSILVLNTECKGRFISLEREVSFNSNNNSEINDKGQTRKIYNFQRIQNYLNSIFALDYMLSKAVHYHALSILKHSIKEKPFGWGLNRYSVAFEYFNTKYPPTKEILKNYNNKDGTNNIVKIFVEFGIFGLIFYLFVFIFLINKHIPIELKLFYVPIIITQSIRGAGYFNGGFILIAFLMLFTYINLYRKLR